MPRHRIGETEPVNFRPPKGFRVVEITLQAAVKQICLVHALISERLLVDVTNDDPETLSFRKSIVSALEVEVDRNRYRELSGSRHIVSSPQAISAIGDKATTFGFVPEYMIYPDGSVAKYDPIAALNTWTHEDSERAVKQGWDIFNAEGEMQIQKHDEAGFFEYDEEAWYLVADNARKGDEHARKALRCVSRDELLKIVDHYLKESIRRLPRVEPAQAEKSTDPLRTEPISPQMVIEAMRQREVRTFENAIKYLNKHLIGEGSVNKVVRVSKDAIPLRKEYLPSFIDLFRARGWKVDDLGDDCSFFSPDLAEYLASKGEKA